MHELTKDNPIILKGECQFVAALDDNGNTILSLFAMESDEILAASVQPIESDPAMSGVVKMFEEKHRQNMTVDCGDVFDGKEFLSDVRSGGIMDYDGFAGPFIVDGYSSNLGLFYPDGFVQGRFVVTEDMFEKICAEHDVKVVWHNR